MATYEASPTDGLEVDRSSITRRHLLAGGGVFLLVGCGGAGGSTTAAPFVATPAPVPTSAPPAPAPVPTPPPVVAGTSATRLKAALATGQVRSEVADDNATVTIGKRRTITGQIIAKDDPRVRLLGGTVATGSGYPKDSFSYGRSVTYAASPDFVTGNTLILEFMLTGNVFELLLLGSQSRENFAIEIDSVPTNADGYDTGPNNDGAFYYLRVTLPASASARRIRVILPNKPYGGLAVPAGAIVAAAPVATPSSAVFIGDSITEGAAATLRVRTWAMQAAYRLGLDNPILSGVGGSGYLAALGRTPGSSARVAGFPDNNFRARTNDVLSAVAGGPPDLAVIAGGANDGGFATAELRAEALAYFQALRAGAPDMAIVVLGPFARYDLYDSQSFAVRDAIFAAVGEVARVSTVDTSSWVTAGNRDDVFNAAVDRTHPRDAGHRLYGELAANGIASIIRAL